MTEVVVAEVGGRGRRGKEIEEINGKGRAVVDEGKAGGGAIVMDILTASVIVLCDVLYRSGKNVEVVGPFKEIPSQFSQFRHERQLPSRFISLAQLEFVWKFE